MTFYSKSIEWSNCACMNFIFLKQPCGVETKNIWSSLFQLLAVPVGLYRCVSELIFKLEHLIVKYVCLRPTFWFALSEICKPFTISYHLIDLIIGLDRYWWSSIWSLYSSRQLLLRTVGIVKYFLRIEGNIRNWVKDFDKDTGMENKYSVLVLSWGLSVPHVTESNPTLFTLMANIKTLKQPAVVRLQWFSNHLTTIFLATSP